MHFITFNPSEFSFTKSTFPSKGKGLISPPFKGGVASNKLEDEVVF